MRRIGTPGLTDFLNIGTEGQWQRNFRDWRELHNGTLENPGFNLNRQVWNNRQSWDNDPPVMLPLAGLQ